MSARARRALLVVHVAVSVGWLGAVAAFLALALAGLRAEDALTVRAAYVAMDLVARLVVVPLSLGSLATGVLQSLVTRWGLARHYWVAAKLLINVVATLVLLLHLAPIGDMAALAVEGDPAQGDARTQALRVQLVATSAAAAVALLAATLLAVVKPRGLTPYGWRRQREERGAA